MHFQLWPALGQSNASHLYGQQCFGKQNTMPCLLSFLASDVQFYTADAAAFLVMPCINNVINDLRSQINSNQSNHNYMKLYYVAKRVTKQLKLSTVVEMCSNSQIVDLNENCKVCNLTEIQVITYIVQSSHVLNCYAKYLSGFLCIQQHLIVNIATD